ncbi:PAS domain S-box protein, partial [Rhizobiaceae sp. 2RAB30]
PSPPTAADGALVPDPRDWLAAIIEGSEDAIVSKNLNGIIQSWNAGATRLFGDAAEEVIGKSITILIPLARIQSGQRIEHFETM